MQLKRASRSERRKKGSSNSSQQIQNPSVFHPHEGTRGECASARAILAFHTDGESKWATKTSPPSPLIRRLFLLPLPTEGCGAPRGKGKGKINKLNLELTALGVWFNFIQTVSVQQPWLFNGELQRVALMRFGCPPEALPHRLALHKF